MSSKLSVVNLLCHRLSFNEVPQNLDHVNLQLECLIDGEILLQTVAIILQNTIEESQAEKSQVSVALNLVNNLEKDGKELFALLCIFEHLLTLVMSGVCHKVLQNKNRVLWNLFLLNEVSNIIIWDVESTHLVTE